MNKLFKGGLVLCMGMTMELASGWCYDMQYETLNSNTDKTSANQTTQVNLQRTCSASPCLTTGTVILHWSPVVNGNWTNPQDIVMTRPSQCGAGQDTDAFAATIPSQSALTRVEFVFHSTGPGFDLWYKDGGKKTGSCTGNTSQVGLPRVPNTSGGNFYFITLETPYVTVDYPQENEVITSPTYTIRIGANASTNNVEVKIDSGGWSQARFDSGYWWFDWANYASGSHTITARGWNELGQNSQTSPRNCTYQP